MLGRHQERWRFKLAEVREIPARIRGLLDKDVLLDPITVRSSLKGECLPEVVLDSRFPEVPQSIMVPHRWRLMWHAGFDREEAIHVLECRAVIAGIRHTIRNARFHSSELVVLTDNMAVALVMSKGRCGDAATNYLLRTLSSYLFAANRYDDSVRKR